MIELNVKEEKSDDEFEGLVRGGGRSGGFMSSYRPWYAVPCSIREFLWIVSLIVSVSVLIVVLSRSEEEKRPICETEDCVKLAGNILTYMNTSADPCDDFHVFACGNFEATHSIPDDKSRLSTFSLLSEANTAKLRLLLESENRVENQATMFYDNCMNLEMLESVGVSPLEELMSRVEFTSNTQIWNSQNLDELSEILAFLSGLEVEPLVGVGVGSDDQNSSRNVLWIGQSGLTLPSREYYVDKDIDQDETLAFLQTHIAEFFELLFNSNSSSPLYSMREDNYNSIARNVVQFEKNLAEIFASKVDLRQPDFYYNPMNLSTLENSIPVLRWRVLLRPLLESGYRYDQRVSESNEPAVPENLFEDALGQDEKLIVETVSYLSNLKDVLDETGRETVLWYLRWHLLESFAHHLNANFREKAFELSKNVYGVEQMAARWKSCVSRANVFDHVSYMFVRKYFTRESLSAAKGMVSDVREATIDNFNNLPWMDSETKVAAVDKCEKIVDKIGYPSFFDEENGIENMYRGWPEDDTSSSSSSYFDTVLQLREFGFSKSSSSLRKPVDRSVWSMAATEVNAYYSPSFNEIVFPAAILQKPFYSSEFPIAFNYGGIGTYCSISLKSKENHSNTNTLQQQEQ